MNLPKVRLVLTAAVMHMLALSAFGQMAQQYQQAAQAYSNAANQCQVPAASACMRQNATYYGCVANQLSGGPSCGSQPTCSTACGGSGGSAGAGSTGISSVNTGNAKNDAIANGVGTAIMLLGKWKMAHDDKKAAQAASATNESSDVDADDSTQSAQLAAQAEAEQQRILNEASQILQQSNALMASNEAGAGPASPGSPPDSTAAIGALLDSGSAAPDSTSAINALLDSTDSQASSAVKTAKTVASLLGGNSEAGAQGASESALPPVPSIQTLDDQEAAETNAVGPDWSQGLANLKDQALSQIGSAVGSIDPVTALDPHLTDDDYLQKGAQAAMQSVLPEPNAAEATLGSVVQEKAIDIASDKVADTLTDSKDQLACSGQGSQVEQDGCMVFMAPTNIARGLYNYGTILVKRFGTMMTDVNTEIWGQPE